MGVWGDGYAGISMPLITPFHRESLGASVGVAPASALWPVANLAIFIPVRFATPVVVTKLLSFNGATASNSIDIGIYAENGGLIVSTGSTLLSGTNGWQAFDIADTQLGAGVYYLAVAMNGTSGTLFASAITVNQGVSFGMIQAASAFALPASPTSAQYAQTYLPVVGMLLAPRTVA